MKQLLLLFLASFMLMTSCKKDTDDEPASYAATQFSLNIPQYFPAPVIPAQNPLTIEGVRLGRKLYFDPILSTNGLSCSSCHERAKSFSIPTFTALTGQVKSVPPHVNLAWNTDYNWNGSEPELDRLCLGDFEPEFFNTNMPLLVNNLSQHPDYPRLFKEAFDINQISSLSHDDLKLKIVYSISQFMRTMVSSDSKFDRFMRHEVSLDQQELDGFILFTTERGDCFHCHGYPLMTNNMFMNNGLDSLPQGFNQGRYWVTGNPVDIGKFSTPTLRNIELTAPYMHDGRFATLEDVVEFYNSGVHLNSPNIDPIMTKAGKEFGLNLTAAEKASLVAFLKTLTDTVFINNPAFVSQ
jgi:cytochrome c peroxidase